MKFMPKKPAVPISIIIPTLNEEKYIGKLLDSLAFQTLKPNQIIIVDAYSQDKTKQIVLSFKKKLPQLKFYQIPKYTIARQRNFGANKTKSKHILFLDADVVLKDLYTLEAYLKEIEQKKPDLAVCFNHPLSDYWKNKFFFAITNSVIILSKNHWPVASAINMYIKRSTFNRIKGFDEELRISEDVEIIHRAIKAKGRFEILKNPKIYTSTRRMDEEGRTSYILKLLRSHFYVMRHGFRGNPIEYEFGKHTKL